MKKIAVYIGILTLIILSLIVYFNPSGSKGELNKPDLIQSPEELEETLTIDDRFNMALDAMNQGQFSDSISEFLLMEKEIDPSHKLYDDIIENVAIGYFKLNQYQDAISYFEQRTLGDNLVLENYLANMYLSSLMLNDQHARLLEVADQYLEKYTDEALRLTVYDHKFNAFIGLEDYDKAKDLNDQLKSSYPDNVNYYLATAFLYQYTASDQVMITYLNDTIAKFPENELLKNILDNYVEDDTSIQ